MKNSFRRSLRRALGRIRRVFNVAPVQTIPRGYGGFGYAHRTSVASANGTLYAVIDLLASATARVEWHLYERVTDRRRVFHSGSEDNRREIVYHPLLRLWNRPNPMMTGQEFRQRTQQHIDLYGESFWYVEMAGTLPVALWLLHPHKMQEVVPDGREVTAWSYRNGNGTMTEYPAAQIIHLQNPNPDDPFRGVSPLSSIGADVRALRSASEYIESFFTNGSMPGGFLKVDGRLDDPEFDRLQLRWRESGRGMENAHRVHILEEGQSWQDAGYKMDDMQFVDLQTQKREQIREAYAVHQHMLGLSTDVNLANAQAAASDFAKWRLVPRLEVLKQALNFQLLPMFVAAGLISAANGVEFDYCDPVEEDSATENAERDSKIRAAQTYINMGFDPVETLQAFGLPVVTFIGKPATPSPVVPDAPASPDVSSAQMHITLDNSAATYSATSPTTSTASATRAAGLVPRSNYNGSTPAATRMLNLMSQVGGSL